MGTVTPSGPPDRPYGSVQGGYGAAIESGSTQSASVDCNGDINTVYSWKPDYPGETPPQQVIVTETCTAKCDGENYGQSGPGAPTCDDGLQDDSAVYSTPIYDPSQPTPVVIGTQINATSTGTHSRVVSGGQSFTVTCSPRASLSVNDGFADASVAYSVADASVAYSVNISPVTVSLTGTIVDSSGGQNILIGQHCTSSLSGTIGTVTYQWSIGGTTFQSWTVSSDQTTTTLVSGPGDLNIANPKWYWCEAPTTETVACTATVTPPSGQGPPFTVTASKQVNVYEPYFGVQNIELGDVGLDFSDSNHPGVKAGVNGTDGFDAEGAVGTPNLFSNEGSGAWAWLQLCNIDRQYTDLYTHVLQTNGYELDSAFPYNTNVGEGPGTPYEATINGNSGNAIRFLFPDSPFAGFSVVATSFSVADYFKLHIMYSPPDGGVGTDWVPLTVMYWGWGADLERNTGSSWPTTSPGSVQFFGHQDIPPYPQWTAAFAGTD